MKRTYLIQIIINSVLAFAEFSFLVTAIRDQSVLYGVFGVLAASAFILNASCKIDNTEE